MNYRKVDLVLADNSTKTITFSELKQGCHFKLTDVDEKGNLLDDAIEKGDALYVAISDLFVNDRGKLAINTLISIDKTSY